MAEKLKIIPLGGLNEIGKNMTVFEFGGEIIVVDCGMAFPGDDMYGIDSIIPDVTYLIKNRARIRGLFITHGHEDHVGAIPYVLKQVNMPIYCTRFTAGLIKLKLEEHGLTKSTKLITVEPGKSVRAGKFTVEFIHVNHSIADSVAFAIHTHMGTVVHTGDFKIDSTPIDGEVIDLARFGELGKEGVLCLCADSTNVERPGFTPSEKTVGATFARQFQNCDERIIVTTFASNVHRIQQVLTAAAQAGRKVAVTGRSMENMMRVSTELGYMKVPKNTLMDISRIKGLPKNKQVIVTTGSQGEEMSALYRMAFSTHKQVELGAGDKVIISASAIPGNEVTVGRVINELFRKGVKVVYDRADMLHVSGHACQEELKIIHALTKPRFFVPLHGEQRMLQIHSQVAQQMGMDRNHIAIADNGTVVELTTKTLKLGGTVPAGEIYVDGAGVGDVGTVVMRDRKRLAEDGMVVVVLPISAHNGDLLSEPEIVTRGFIYVKESGDLMKELQSVAQDAAESVSRKRARDDGELRGTVKSAVSSYLFKTTRRSPMVIPVVTRL
ncbi:ribonuclease J [Pusillibacter faecalis]|uniref:Ribonuclease J n=3 Tax=Pusillibacter faecalis TaxID=2714358 RepID=A0A810QCD1_9FIRM|nr:ribonuclease J [Pusillibacter faecalis]MBS5657355.1 ribonuclease J [Oscillibacter sp.]BCK84225.1 ribonuclease J [Pusillibacter faecalis]